MLKRLIGGLLLLVGMSSVACGMERPVVPIDQFSRFQEYVQKNLKTIVEDIHALLNQGLPWDQIETLQRWLSDLDKDPKTVFLIQLAKDLSMLCRYKADWEILCDCIYKQSLSEEDFVRLSEQAVAGLPEDQKEWVYSVHTPEGITLRKLWEQQRDEMARSNDSDDEV